jgi:RNA polymerase sigma-70 factor (ECF subfamily)
MPSPIAGRFYTGWPAIWLWIICVAKPANARDGGALDEDWPCPCPLPERFVQGEQQWSAVESWLYDLPVLSQQILYLRRLDGKRHQQIAAELQVSERHVEHVLYRTGRMLAGDDF